MIEKRARSKTLLPFLTPDSGTVFLSCVALLMLACGCSMRKRPNIPWAKAVQVRPVLQARGAGSEVASVTAPELKFEVPSFATVLVPARNGPTRPHGSAPSSTGAGADAERMEAPTIASQLTPQETVVAREKPRLCAWKDFKCGANGPAVENQGLSEGCPGSGASWRLETGPQPSQEGTGALRGTQGIFLEFERQCFLCGRGNS